jgi:rhamnosyltransferase
MSGRARARLTLRGIVGDTLRILRDPEFSRKRKLYWLVLNPRYQVVKWHSYRASTLVDLDDAEAIVAGSLEHHRKRS